MYSFNHIKHFNILLINFRFEVKDPFEKFFSVFYQFHSNLAKIFQCKNFKAPKFQSTVDLWRLHSDRFETGGSTIGGTGNSGQPDPQLFHLMSRIFSKT